jgi:hypothetical protein
MSVRPFILADLDQTTERYRKQPSSRIHMTKMLLPERLQYFNKPHCFEKTVSAVKVSKAFSNQLLQHGYLAHVRSLHNALSLYRQVIRKRDAHF